MVIDGVARAMIPPPDDPPASSTSSPVSPVEWHVILWILITLGVNSMAQPSQRFFYATPSPIYLHISPILCLVDASATIIYIIVSKFHLDTSFETASKSVLVYKASYGTGKLQWGEGRLPGNTWLRWPFFVLGPLPAIIKLCSFSGMPWTKTWGLMFIVPLLVFEVANNLLRYDASEEGLAEVRWGHGCEEWNGPPFQDHAVKCGRLLVRMERFYKFFMGIGFVVHLFVVGYAALPLWHAFHEFAPPSALRKELSSIITLMVLLFLAVSAVMRCCVCRRMWKEDMMTLVLSWVCVLCAASTYPTLQTPQTGIFPPMPKALQALVGVGRIVSIFLGLSLWGMACICRRWPNVAKALLLDRKTLEEGQKKEHSTPAQVVEGRNEEPSSSVQVEEGQIEAPSTPAKVVEEPFDKDAFLSLVSFLLTFLVCILWYAYLYDPTGTVNPSWTKVFGRSHY